ncbi:YafY family transcriptional regulator [Kosakonia cowanii]|uniref:helix-turn-helix transcriptional regulator n=1 Tax=Kosakonia cowanii TaxID=208223 RepID=UPI00111FE4B8|nr:YafY family protein [Kosakonia cowanii]MDP9767493.1 putative DNA-binding transcriptional regulator YafY [Atlantibacter hermannii]TPD67581.1 YafY family transcriptional regulator [Kosakonia cowanii]TPD90811.1 YafY family transcriptional regulator [Kosakonia cowanii]TPE07574.1 YafY family transcriptional regulator [Kosakonia cowanii]
MSASGPARAARLLALLQILARHRYPVSGASLAEELSISLRTLYRDIASLRAQGADIQGEAGTGYVLAPGYLLPPMMFTPEQLDALALGLRWVATYGDAEIGKAANEVAGKVMQSIPPPMQSLFEHATLLVGRAETAVESEHVAGLRAAIRRQLKVSIRYTDRQGNTSERVIWPFALGYLSRDLLLAAWCETRGDFRHFAVAQIESVQQLACAAPHSRQRLLRMWREAGRDTLDEISGAAPALRLDSTQ